jgi:hypothetical protein
MFDGIKLSEWDSVALTMDERIELYYLFVSTVLKMENRQQMIQKKYDDLKTKIGLLAKE